LAVFHGRFDKVVFIVSSGRTGTTALATHLDKTYPNVRALHEPTPSWRLRRASNKALCGHMTKEQLVRLLADSRRKLVTSIDRPIYIESNPYLGGFLDAFGEVFDNPFIIHVVRDPRSFVRSSVNFGTFAGIKRWAQAFVPYWLPKPENFAQPGEASWAQMSEPARLAWYWAILNTELNRGRELFGPRYLRIRFEDLFKPDGAGLRQLTDFIGIPYDQRLAESANSEKVNASSSGRMPRWQDWDPATLREVLGFCEPLMKEYGYGPADSSPASSPSPLQQANA
jgi:hypothetical protein